MPRPRHAWILDAPRDLLLLIATPVVILPLLALARATWSDAAIAGVVLAFGATGHHLPGLLRAYGDRDLFERFRARFIFGPVLLFIVCLFFYAFHFQGMIAMVTAWGTNARTVAAPCTSTLRITSWPDLRPSLTWLRGTPYQLP